MTLLKQIIIVTLLVMALLLSSVMIIIYIESKQYIEKELYKNTVNSLSVVSNKLSESEGEKAYIQSVINSEFDSGYYKSLAFQSYDGNWTYTQEYNDSCKDIPSWFLNFTNITPQVLSKEVSSGWNIFGKIYLEADSSALYITLYKTFIDLIYLFIIFSILSMLAIHIILKIILKPLANIEEQALAIIYDQFIIQKNIPKTLEFRDVVLAMNSMVKKIKFILDNLSKELEELKKEDYIDAGTKLKSRKYLLSKLPEYLKLDAQKTGGVNIIIKLDRVIDANKKLGRAEVDKLYMDIITLFKEATKEFEDIIIARINETEFDIFIPSCSIDQVTDNIQWIKKESIKIIKGYDLDQYQVYLSFGICEYNHNQNISELLAGADNALQKAKNNSSHIYYQKLDSKTETKGKEKWRKIINKSIEEKAFSFNTFDAIDTKTNKYVHSVLNIVMNTEEKTYSYEEFMPIAIELGLSPKIYSQALSMLVGSSEIKFSPLVNTLRLPDDYLDSKSSYETLKQLCIEFSSQEKHTLTVEISDKFIRENPLFIEIYNEIFKKYNIHIGIFEFIAESDHYDYLQDIHPDYIKIDAYFLLSETFQELTTLRIFAKTLDISLIATGVTEEITVKNLQEIGISIMQGSYISQAHL